VTSHEWTASKIDLSVSGIEPKGRVLPKSPVLIAPFI
jgi:hypothetical protein